MSGHQGIKRTIDRVLQSFYWPGVQEAVRRYVRSCDACQRTYPKSRVGKAPLGRMPLIDTPFERVAVDIIGPLKPISHMGNRYILTLVDFATRYPDAIALPSIDSATVAEALVEMFSRIGFPREVLCDQASCFTSELMREVNDLLAIKHLSSTPYHPMCNGLVERFNGTLKQMLRKLCQEEPKTWDRLLAPLLFAYREVPQASLGFSPFELIYGRNVRGPLSLLKELWTGDNQSEEVKTTYGYVLDLRDRLEKTLQLAQENLSRAKTTQKKYYDRGSRMRRLKVGDRALVLLPTTENKLMMHWKGPFRVTGKKGDSDYWLDMGHTTKLFHINMLKRYEERPPEISPQSASFIVVEEEETDTPVPTFKATEGFGTEAIKLGPNLRNRQREEIDELLATHKDVFSEVPGKTNLLECRLKLTTSEPINTPQYPLPFAMKEVVEKEVGEMLRLGVIERSDSPYNSPLVLVKKPDKSYRTCIDFRRINDVLVSDAEPIPRTDVLFTEIGTRKFFSKFDLTKGYWQVPLDKESRLKTAFSTQSGHYHFLYMPFGIKTASAVFTRLMRRLLQGIPNVVHYIDDVLVATTTWEEHMQTLSELMNRIREAGLKIKPQKSEIGMTSIVFLGHRLGDGTIQPVEDTIIKIAKAPLPTTKKQLRSFLGLAGYYRDLIPHYAEKALPLTEMTKKRESNKINWNIEGQTAFETLKQALASGPILKAPDLKRGFVLRSDASDSCIGAVLMQEHDGVLYPVKYASRQLLPREQNYSTIERECLALVWAVEKFHIFLYGTYFTVQTDHQPLQYLSRAKHLNSRVLRWSLVLQEYNFHVEHIKGSENVGADYMSRLQ
uniref:RNA-directed DNA polymerase n=1 Tax=Rhipicephalus microplus TaxID=6941 RepID=A0A6G5ABF5_RHIMP